MDQTAPAPNKESTSVLDDVLSAIKKAIDYVRAMPWPAIARDPGCWAIVFLFLGTVLTFWPLLKTTGQSWMVNEYYSHGWIIPILFGWQLKVRAEDWKKIPNSFNGTIALVAVPLILAVQYIAFVGDFWMVQSVLLIASLLMISLAAFGWKRALLLCMPIMFLLFGLPVFNTFIEGSTNQLQLWSTTVAETLLRLFGLNPLRLNETDIQLNTYSLTVAVPCSGMKLLVAVSCFTAHFTLIARKDWFFTFLMFALIVPLCLFINGLRIALIGVVGEMRGSEAAAQFHDYSGYITLLICFFILFKFARMFGWKD